MEYDVIVVGAGGSGLAAAYSAAQHGGRVLVLEKESQPGGTTGIAVGSFTAAGTSLQRRRGITDDPEAHAEDAAKFASAEIESRNQTELRRFFLAEAAATYDWLEQLGLNFVGPSPEPPNRANRMHNVIPGAKAYILAFQLALRRFGVEVRCHARVEQLLIEGKRVVGVQATVDGEAKEFHALKGVILAAGDYANRPGLIAKYKGDRFAQIEGINPYALGDGHDLAERVGAQLINMDVTYGPELRFVANRERPFQQWLPASGPVARIAAITARCLPLWIMRRMVQRLLVTWQHPEDSLFDDGAILVNQHGLRFTNETDWPRREIAVAEQPDKVAYILLDGRLVELYSRWPKFISTAPDIAYAYVKDYEKLRPDVTVRADSLAHVARARGLDHEALNETVARFNACVEGNQPDPFGRTDDAHRLEARPWVLLGPLKAYFTTTEGGAAVSRSLEVLDRQGEVIPGLYAVGQNGLGGMILWGHGLHIAWALTSGRLAGIAVMTTTSGEPSASAGQ